MECYPVVIVLAGMASGVVRARRLMRDDGGALGDVVGFVG